MRKIINSIRDEELRIALQESVKLQSHYAKLLNAWDGGARLEFKDADAWIARLRVCGRITTKSGETKTA